MGGCRRCCKKRCRYEDEVAVAHHIGLSEDTGACFCVANEEGFVCDANPRRRKVILIFIDQRFSLRFNQYGLERVTRMFASLLKV